MGNLKTEEFGKFFWWQDNSSPGKVDLVVLKRDTNIHMDHCLRYKD